MKTVRYRFVLASLCMLAASYVCAGSQVYVRVVDQNGANVPGALAVVFPPSSSGLPPQLKTTAVDGKAAFPINPNTPYTIYVSSHGMSPTLKQQFESSPRTVQASNSSTVIVATVTMHRDLMLSSAGRIALTVRGLADLGVNENTLLMAEVSNTVTGEKVAFSGAMWGSVSSSHVVLIPNIPPAAAGNYSLSVNVSTRQIGCSVVMTTSVVAGQTCVFFVSSSAFALSNTVDRADGLSGSIAFEGIVTDLENRGLKDCTVTLWRKVRQFDWGESINEAEVLTDFNGYFSFYDVLPGTYAVQIAKAGYEGFRFEGDGYGNNGINTSIFPHTRVRGGGPDGYIQLREAHGVMTGRVTMNAGSVPVAFAEVNIWPDDSLWPALSPGMQTSATGGYDNYYTTGTEHRGGRTSGRARTDIDGRFTIGGLGHGNYRVEVHSQNTDGTVTYNNGPDRSSTWNRSGDDLRVTVSTGTGSYWPTTVYATNGNVVGEMNIDLGTYTPPAGIISGTITFDVPQEYVHISTMSPLTIWAYQRDSEGQSRNYYCVVSGTVTRSFNYELNVATSGKYEVKPRSRDWGTVNGNYREVDLQNQTTASGVDLKLGHAGTIRGIVRLPDGKMFKPTWSELRKRIMDINARGINVMTGDGQQVDNSGYFEIMGLIPGSYRLSTRGEYQTRLSTATDAWESEALPWPDVALTGVAVRAGQVTTVEMQLQGGALVVPKTPMLPAVLPRTTDYTTAGTRYAILRFPSATGVTRATLSAMLGGGRNDFKRDTDFVYDPATGWKGRSIPAGRYDFHLVRIDRFTVADKNELPEGEEPCEHYSITFISQLKNTEITYDPLRQGTTTWLEFASGTLGQSVLRGGVRGERIFTAADVDRFKQSGMDLFFQYIPSVMLYDTDGQLKAFGMALPLAERLLAEDGWKNQIDGNRFSYAWIRDEIENHPLSYVMERLPAGDYVAVFETPNYPPMMRKVTLSSGDRVFDVNFASNVIVGSGVHGVVKSTDGVVLANATVTLAHRTMTKTIMTDADGIFAASGLPPGTYRMTVTKPGFAPAADKFGLGRDAVVFDNGSEVVLTRSDALLQGTVYSQKMPSPKVSVGAKIVAYNETYNVAHPDKMLPALSTKTDEKGEFILEGLISGDIYKIFVVAPGKMLEWQTFGTADKPLLSGTTTQTGDFVLKTLPARLKVSMSKIYENGRFQYQFLIESPKKIINPANQSVLAAPYCRYSPVVSASGSFDPASAVEALPLIGPEYTTEDGGKTYSYNLKIPVLSDSEYYKLRIEATDGASDFSEDILFGPKIEAKAKKDIKEELAVGGNIPIDDTGSDATQVTLDPGSLTASGAETSSIRQNDVDVPIGGFLSAMPNFNLSRTGSLKSAAMARIKEAIIASDVYEIGLDDAQMNRSLSLNLKFDISAVDDAELGNLLICGYNPHTDAWEPVRGAVTIDPVTGVVSVDVDSLAESTGGAQSAPSAGRAVVSKGMYTINKAASTSQSGVFAVFKQDPSAAKAYAGGDFSIINFPNPFDLKAKTVTMQDVNADFSQSVTGTMLKYALPSDRAGRVVFCIYNLAGELVRELDEGTRTGGFYYYTEWDGRNDNGEKCASGVYFLIAKCDGKKLTGTAHKLAILK